MIGFTILICETVMPDLDRDAAEIWPDHLRRLHES